MLLNNFKLKLQSPIKFKNTIFASLLFLVNLITAQSIDKTEGLFSPQNRLKFGNYLFDEKDYLRSVYEFREYLKSENNDTIRFRMAFAFSEIGRLTEAGDNFKGLFFSSLLSEEAKLEYFKIKFFEGNTDVFRDLVQTSPFVPQTYQKDISRLNQLSYLIEGNSLPDSSEIENLFSDNEKIELLKFYLRKKNPGYKSPTTASVLSAIVPGLGKIYADEIGDGVTAFVFTGLLTFLAYDNFKAEHNFRAWIFTGLASWFYAGNIYGSAAAAQNYNAGIRFNFNNDLKIYLDSKNYFLPKYDFMNKWNEVIVC